MNGLARTDCAPQKEGIICFPQVTLSLQCFAQCDCIWSRNARRRCLRLSMCLRSEEHTSELQSRQYLVCRLLLEKKKKKKQYTQRGKTYQDILEEDNTGEMIQVGSVAASKMSPFTKATSRLADHQYVVNAELVVS